MPALLSEVRNHIAYLTLNRPQVHNSINPELMVQLAEAWERVNADDDIRIAIVTGAGDKAFCAGADLGRLIPLTTGARQPEDEWDQKILRSWRASITRATHCCAATTFTNRSSARSTDSASRVGWN